MDITKEESAPSNGQGITKPDLDAPEKDRTPRWYYDVARYYASFYNRMPSSFEVEEDRKNILSPAEQMRVHYAYYLGRQPNLNYNHIVNTSTTSTIQPLWNKGQKVKQIVDHLIGTMSEILSNAKITTIALSKNAKNKRSKMIEDIMTKYDAAPIFEDLKKNFGVSFSPIEPKKPVADEEDLAKWAEFDYKEQGEIYAQMIANDLYVKNKGFSKYTTAGRDTFIAGLTGIHHYVENGLAKQQVIPPYNAILDLSNEDDFNRKAQFRGFVERLPLSTVIKRWGGKKRGLSESDIAELKKMSKEGVSDEFIAQYGTTNNLRWYDTFSGENKTVDTVGVVTMYWVTLRDTRYKVSEDQYGNKNIKKLNDEKKKNINQKGDYYVVDVCKATVIGNRWVVDYGYINNIVRSAENQSDVEMPIKFYIPNMVLDQYRSLVSRIAELQDSIDICRYKIKEVMGRDLGKQFIINGNKMGSTTAKTLITDFKAMGLSVVEGTSGEEGDPSQNQNLVNVIDMTLDPNISKYVELSSYYENLMEEISSVPKVALGQETKVGLGVQQNTIQTASKANLNLFNGFAKFVEENIQYATNCQKNIYAIEGNTDAEWVIGERGLEYIRATKDFIFENFLIYLKIENVIDEQSRKELFDIAFNLSQNGMLDIIDWLKIKESKNMTELQNYFEYAVNKKERKAKEAQMAAQEQQMAMMQQQDQAKMQQVAMKEEGANQRADSKNQLTAVTEAAKLSAQPEPMQQ